MITNPVDYRNAILHIENNRLNKPQFAILLPTDEKIYEVDLNKRTTTAPDFLSITADQYAETIYFKVDRFHDHMDLADTCCTIQYLNSGDPDDEGHMYIVPFYDITTYKEEKKILFPWQISSQVARASGTITFSIRFFKLFKHPDTGKSEYIYNLNIQPAKSKILLGMNLNLETNDGFYISPDNYTYLVNEINKLSNMLGVKWIENPNDLFT